MKKKDSLKFAVVKKEHVAHGQVSKLRNLTIILAVIGAVLLIAGIGLRITGHVTIMGESDVCIGTPTAVCSDFSDYSDLCSNYGCSFNSGSCNEPPSCETYSVEECESHEGCSFWESCSGEDCGSYSDNSSCEAVPNCDWISGCSGMPMAPCNTHSYDNCMNFGGCSQTSSCTGDVTCSNFDYDDIGCMQSGCDWGGSCSGSIDCSSLAGGPCDEVSGCTSGGECSGSTDCSSIVDGEECTYMESYGCFWDSNSSTCSGTIECAQWDDYDCSQIGQSYGCSWNPTCEGEGDCSSYGDSECIYWGPYGCSWDSYCSSSGSESCEYLDNDEYYCGQAGCTSEQSCEGEPWPSYCYAYYGEICSEAGCDWYPDTCTGDLTCENIYDSYYCGEIGGCFWLEEGGDYDDDGILNEDDNCPEVPNENQTDSDSEYVGTNFTKENYESAEDCIRDDTCIHRDNSGAVYNSRGYSIYWACGHCGEETSQYYDQITYLTSYYNGYDYCISGGMANIPGVDTCLYIPSAPGQSEQYWDIHWNSWQSGGGGGNTAGGGFSYTRSSILTDNIGDACDECPLDRINDDDEDDVCGIEDNCDYEYNPEQNDSDGDGFGDECDNCPEDYNPEQNDTDNDGEGDVCDADIDGDMILNEEDNCVYDWNMGQEDSDLTSLCSNCDPECIDYALDEECGGDFDCAKEFCMLDGGCYCNSECISDNYDYCGGDIECAEMFCLLDYGCDCNPECIDYALNEECDCDSDCIDYALDVECSNDFDCAKNYCDCDDDFITCAKEFCMDEGECSDYTCNLLEGDGIGDVCDNCQYNYNPEQENSDGDLYGDVCDNCVYVANAEWIGEFPSGYEAGQEDSDQDGVGDACDNCANTDCPQRRLQVPMYEGTSYDGYCESLTKEECESETYYQINSNGDSKSCYWGTGWNNGNPSEGCWACGPSNEEQEYCSNACEPVILCGEDEYVGQEGCNEIDSEEECINSFQTNNNGDLKSCYWGNPYWSYDSEGCWGCGPNNENNWLCMNECRGDAYNPEQENEDDDEFGDICDICASDPLNDGDSDGICDSSDICVGDAINDPDEDEVCGNIDNCPYISNPEQENSNDNVYGDTCENTVPYSAIAPNVTDGIFDADEWSDAEVVSFYYIPQSEHPEGYIYIYEKHDEDYVYFAADVTPDNTEEEDDTFGTRLDVGNNNAWCNNDDGPDRDGEWVIYGDDEQDTGCYAGSFKSSAGFGMTPNVGYAHRFFEIAIPIESLGGSEEGGQFYNFPVGKLFWGYGTLSPQWTYPVQTDPYDVSQYLDMFLEESPQLSELFRVETDGMIFDAEADDIDSDGDMEIVFADDSSRSTVRAVDALTGDLVWENTGYSGTFVEIGDFYYEGTGAFKGVVVLSNYYLNIFNAVNGEYVTQIYVPCYALSDLKLGDFNGDEYDDIVYSDRCAESTVRAISGNGFGWLWAYYSPVREIAVGKLTDDDIDDVAFAGDYFNDMYACGVIDGSNGEVLFNDCSYAYESWYQSEPYYYLYYYNYTEARAVAVADVNKDGYDDAIFGEYYYDYFYNNDQREPDNYIYESHSYDSQTAAVFYSHQATESGFLRASSEDFGSSISDISAVKGKTAVITNGLGGENAQTIYLLGENMETIVDKPHSVYLNEDIGIGLVDIENCGVNAFGSVAIDDNIYLYREDGTNLGMAAFNDGETKMFKILSLGGGKCVAIAVNYAESDGIGPLSASSKGDNLQAAGGNGGSTGEGTLHVFEFKASSVTSVPQGTYTEEKKNTDGSANVTIKNEGTGNKVFVINLPANTTFNMANVTVNVSEGKIIKITGMNHSKKVYFVNATDKLCILDSENLASLTVDDTCEDAGEFNIDCPGIAFSPNGGTVTCTLDGTTAVVGPLNHSGVTVFVVGASVSAATGGTGGGGGSTGCISKWECGAWSSCSRDKTMTRTCVDNGGCKKPDKTEISSCEYIPGVEEEKPAGTGIIASIKEGLLSGLTGALSIIIIAFGIIVLIGAGISFKFWLKQRRKYRF